MVRGTGCGGGVQVDLLILDLNRVLMSVDLPSPVSPVVCVGCVCVWCGVGVCACVCGVWSVCVCV